MPPRYFTRADIVLIVALTVLSALSLTAVHGLGFGGKHAVIEAGGVRVMELPLSKDTVERVAGPLGETVIVVEDGSVRIEDSPCPNHYCSRMGRLSHRGEIAVCVPNRVVVTIKGGSDDESFDGVTQ